MATISYPYILEQLIINELSKKSDKKAIITGYESLVEILQVHDIQRYLHGCHEQLFQCISRIISNPCHQYFEDQQLQRLLELASYSRILTMSQNQIVNDWRRNIPKRSFQEIDDEEEDIEEDGDDNSWSEETIESEDDDAGAALSVLNLRKFKGDKGGQVLSTMNSAGEQSARFQTRMNDIKDRGLKKSASKKSQSNKSIYEENDNGHLDYRHESHIQERVCSFSHKMNRNVKFSFDNQQSDKRKSQERNSTFIDYTKENNEKHEFSQRSDKDFLKSPVDRSRLPVADYLTKASTEKKNKKSISSPIPMKIPPKGKNLKSATGKTDLDSTLSGTSLNKANKMNFNNEDEAKIQKIYNCVATLMGGNQTADVLKETFDTCYQLIKELEKACAGQLAKVFYGKASSFYSLLCHIAQNDFLFQNQEYTKLYQLRKLLLANKSEELKEDSESFARSRPLISLVKIADSLKATSQLLLTIFNDLQEHVIRCQPPITADLYNVIKLLLKSTIVVDTTCFDHFIDRILFDMKKEIFSDIQLEELRSYIEIRRKRFDRSKQKQTWKQRLLLLKCDQLSCDMNRWIDELRTILQSDPGEPRSTNENVIDHSVWYFAVLIMASSGYLTGEQFKILLEQASQSPLFNPVQKFYLKHYLDNGQAPIMIEELKAIKAKLQSIDQEDKRSAYGDVVSILRRQKPPYISEKSDTMPTTNDEVAVSKIEKKSNLDSIRIVDDHVMQSLMTIVESIGWDKETFTKQDKCELIEIFTNESTIVRPLSQSELKRLQSLNNDYLSLNELKEITMNISTDLTELITAMKERSLPKNDEFLDFLAITLIHIFENQSKFSDEKCNELKSLVDKNLFGKKRFKSINQTYDTARRIAKESPVNEPIVTAMMLSTSFEQILKRDSKTFQQILNLLENLTKTTRYNETTIDGEINRCLLSAIILEMTKFDESEFEKELQQLKKLLTSRVEFFTSIFTQSQFKILENFLECAPINHIHPLIQTLETRFSDQHFLNLLAFVENNFIEKIHFNPLLRLILSSFDHSLLPVDNNLTLIKMIHDHPNLKNHSLKHQLDFLANLLENNVHISPKVIRHKLEAGQIDEKIVNQIITILTISKNQNASREWKLEMVQVLLLLHRQNRYQHQLRIALQQSEMLQATEFKQHLKCYQINDSTKLTVKNKQNNASNKAYADSIDSSAVHRKMFALLLSEKQSDSLLVIDQCRTILTDQQLPSNIRLNKFIEALEIIIKRPKQMLQISVSQWAELFRKNRGKIFKIDEQCDNLLLLTLLTDLNLPVDTLIKLPELLQSRETAQRNNGLRSLMTLLKNTQIVHEKDTANHLPSKANQIYAIITIVIFNEMYSDEQVQRCLSTAKKSWLFNDQQRRKLEETL